MQKSMSVLFAVLGLLSTTVLAGDFERPPISYSDSPADNVVSRLQEKLDRKEVALKFDAKFGYLTSVLQELNVSTTSQTLVFSKTSVQRPKIAPRTPRAVYFNDDVYIGFCHRGDVVEVSVTDGKLGAAFYTLDQVEVARPQFKRHADHCLICHGSTHTMGVPGHMVRSVYTDAGGEPILSAGGYRVDHSTQFERRWGGWYVTGSHGKQTHRGNLIIRGNRVDEPVDNAAGQNVTDLSHHFNVSNYLTGTSDIVALMILEHQGAGQNLITQANFTVRQALHYESSLNKELGEKPDHKWESTASRIKSAGEPLVRYMLLSSEAPLTEKIAGTSGYSEYFMKLGKRDSKGRSLRDLDLETRLFKYPCSYLIDTEFFGALHPDMKKYVYDRMWQVLSGQDDSKEFAHLSKQDRANILEILLETHEGVPPAWKSGEKTK